MPIVKILVFVATFLTYNAHRLFTMPDAASDTLSHMHRWMRENRWLHISMLLCGAIILVVAILQISSSLLFMSVILMILTYVYIMPLPFFGDVQLRTIGWLKPFWIAGIWSLVCVILPLYGADCLDGWNTMLAIHAFLFFAAITMPFDIRDMVFDRQKLRYPTLPMLWGIQAVKAGSVMLLALSFVVLFAMNIPYLIETVCWYGITAWWIITTQEHSGEYHYTFWLDGSIMLGYVLMTVGDSLR